MTEGTVFDIQHFCMDDGPGIRITVFLKGCPLRCIWCHNAEGLLAQKQLWFAAEKCVLCGKCLDVCPKGCHSIENGVHTIKRSMRTDSTGTCAGSTYHNTSCVACGKCAEVCPADALRICGRTMSAAEVIEDVEKDQPFYVTSDGGMTLSGGEPLSQSGFALELLSLAKQRGIHTCVETSGFCPEEVIQKAAEDTDLFLFDIKETDPLLHRRFTGVDNERILRNLELLSGMEKPVILRCPVIPGCNDREEHFLKIAQLAETFTGIQEIHLEPYHPFGLDKYEKLGMDARYRNSEFMPEEAVRGWQEFLRRYTDVEVKIS